MDTSAESDSNCALERPAGLRRVHPALLAMSAAAVAAAGAVMAGEVSGVLAGLALSNMGKLGGL